jgi:hypothetical protein
MSGNKSSGIGSPIRDDHQGGTFKKKASHLPDELPGSKEINELYDRLSQEVGKIDDRIENLQDCVETSFKKVYEDEMSVLEDKIEAMRREATDEEIFKRKDAKMVELLTELDSYKNESIYLHKQCKE